MNENHVAMKHRPNYQRIRVGPIRKLRLAPVLERATPAQAVLHLHQLLQDDLACALFERMAS